MYKSLSICFCFGFMTCSHNSFGYEIETIIHSQESGTASNVLIEDKDSVEVLEDSLTGVSASSGSIDDVLRLSPAATTARGPRSSGETPQVRGLDGNKIFVKIDGARQNFQGGHTSMTPMDTENLKAVQIFKSTSGNSESGTIGGGLNFVTISAEDILKRNKKSGTQAKFQFNSSNRESISNVKFAQKNTKSSVLLSVTNAVADNLNLSDGTQLDNSSYEDLAALVRYNTRKYDLKFEHFQRSDTAPRDPSLNPPGRLTSLLSDNLTMRNNVSVNYKGFKGFNLLAYYNGHTELKDNRETRIVDTRLIQTLGIKADKSLNVLRFGIEAYKDELSSDRNGSNIANFPEANSENFATYLLADIKIGDSGLTFVPGLKGVSYNLRSDTGMKNKSESKVLKEAKLKYSSDFGFNAYASYLEGFNAPRVNEVYAQGLHDRGDGFVIRDNFFIPNEQLVAETSKTNEFGIGYSVTTKSGAMIEASVNYFESDFNNYIVQERIDRSVVDPVNGSTQIINIPSANLFGNEVELKGIFNTFEIRAIYSELRGKNNTSNLFLEDLPADQYSFDFRYFIDSKGLTIGYLSNLVSDQTRVNPETIQRTDPTEGYLIHNAFINKRFKNIDLNLRVDNFTDRKYRRHASHLFESGIDAKFSLKYRINTI